jgi:hypothetical protein
MEPPEALELAPLIAQRRQVKLGRRLDHGQRIDPHAAGDRPRRHRPAQADPDQANPRAALAQPGHRHADILLDAGNPQRAPAGAVAIQVDREQREAGRAQLAQHAPGVLGLVVAGAVADHQAAARESGRLDQQGRHAVAVGGRQLDGADAGRAGRQHAQRVVAQAAQRGRRQLERQGQRQQPGRDRA